MTPPPDPPPPPLPPVLAWVYWPSARDEAARSRFWETRRKVGSLKATAVLFPHRRRRLP